jgi:hypothetical protein
MRGRPALAAGWALTVDSARYWASVAPRVRTQVRGAYARAMAIPDSRLRALALGKLSEESFNAETAAMLATLAPRRRRADAITAIVACELLYDYLDAVTEESLDPDEASERMGLLSEAVAPGAPAGAQAGEDGGYARALVAASQGALARLPAAAAVDAAVKRGAARCAEAQVRIHTSAERELVLAGSGTRRERVAPDADTGHAELCSWAQRAALGTGLEWRTYLAGAAASIVAVHALIAAAADPRTTAAQARAIDDAYLSVSALTTMLDSLVDYERDAHEGARWLVRHYGDRERLAEALAAHVRHTEAQLRALPHAAHHLMLLVGAVAYLSSGVPADDTRTRALLAPIHAQLRPLAAPTLAYMRVWRAAKRSGRPRGACETPAGAAGSRP